MSASPLSSLQREPQLVFRLHIRHKSAIELTLLAFLKKVFDNHLAILG